MKAVIKQLFYKFIIIFIINIICIPILSIIFNYGTNVIGNLSFFSKEWIINYFKDYQFRYVLTLIPLLSIVFLVYVESYIRIVNKRGLCISIIVGNIIIAYSIRFWWGFVERLALNNIRRGYGGIIIDDLTYSFERLLGDKTGILWKIIVILCLEYSISILLSGIYILFSNKYAVFLREGMEPVIGSSIAFLVFFMFFPIFHPVVLRVFSMPAIIFMWNVAIIFFSLSAFNVYNKIKKYISDCIGHDEYSYVVVNELGNRCEGYYNFFTENKDFLYECKESGIAVIPNIMDSEVDYSIVIDLYNNGAVFDTHTGLKKIDNTEFFFRFAIAEPQDDLDKNIDYLKIFDKFNTENMTEILKYTDRIKYIRIVRGVVCKAKEILLHKSDVISQKIYSSLQILEREIYGNYVFDMVLNMMEMLNYYFALLLIEHEDIELKKDSKWINKSIRYADWGKWIIIRHKLIKKQATDDYLTVYKNVMNENIADDSVKYSIDIMLRAIAVAGEEEQQQSKGSSGIKDSDDVGEQLTEELHRKQEEETLNIDDLFKMIKLFRNKTKGHGVTPHIISDRLNQALIEVTVYLIIKLNEINNNNFQEQWLKDSGWIFVKDGVYYFLYSYSENDKKYDYHSFVTGIKKIQIDE